MMKTEFLQVEITYMTDKVLLPFGVIKSCSSFPTDNLEHDDTKAKNIGFDWEKSIQSVLRGHVTAAQ